MSTPERLCPTHGTALEGRGKRWFCAACDAEYAVRGTCGDCGSTLEKVAACGASNWWCPRCNELKSKKAVQTELVRA